MVAFDLGRDARAAVAAEGPSTAATLDELVAKLDAAARRVGDGAGRSATDEHDRDPRRGSSTAGDVVIDGGNSNYKEAAPTAQTLAQNGVGFVDAGTSGGIWGLTNGYCLMVGGTDEAVGVCEPIFLALAPEGGYAHVGPVGAGHFVKMVHNGIEYGLMQAYAEGFEIMDEADEFYLDLHQIAAIWRYGSVVRSWLLELTERALAPGVGLRADRGRTSSTPARAAGPSRRPSTAACPRRSSPRRSSTGSPSREPMTPSLPAARRAAQPVRRPRRGHRAGTRAEAARPGDAVVTTTARRPRRLDIDAEALPDPSHRPSRGPPAVALVIFGASGDLTARKILPATRRARRPRFAARRVHADRRGPHRVERRGVPGGWPRGRRPRRRP